MPNDTDNRFPFTENDTADVLQGRFGYYDGDGVFVPLDATGYTFTLKIAYPKAPFSKEAVITDAPGGLYEFRFDFGELKRDTHVAHVMITFPNGQEKHSPKFYLDIDSRVKG